MFLPHLLTPLLAALLATVVRAQDVVYDAEHNATALTGTWSSGSMAVRTGSGFSNPANKSFTYPKTTGVSYSFSDDGFYEISRYRFNSNGSEPTCITGVIGWVHGRYALQPNGSLIMTPLGDGYQQIQDPCAAVSNFIEDYNLTELYQSWRIFQDITTTPPVFKLHLFQFDGAPLAPQFQVSAQPIMLPTRLLRNVTLPGTTTDGLTTQNQNRAVLTGDSSRTAEMTVGLVLGTFTMGLAALML